MYHPSLARRRLTRLLVAGAVGVSLALGMGAAFTPDAMAGWFWA